MHKMWFNTGVTPSSGSPLYGSQVWKDGVKQIPYWLEHAPPKGCVLQGLSNYPNDNTIAIEIVKGDVHSKYAMFSKPIW